MCQRLVSGLLVGLVVVAYRGHTMNAFGGILNLGPEQVVQANGSDIIVPQYSVPYYGDWDNDGRNDLIVGEGGYDVDGKVRVYLNVGTNHEPQFSDYQYVQSAGSDLVVPATPASGCLGAFPLVTDYDDDGRKDLLVGSGDGTLKIYLNTGTDEAPTFDAGTPVEFGPAGAKSPIDVGSRATLAVVDWDGDGRDDFVSGDRDGRIHLYLNRSESGAPDFVSETIVPSGGSDLMVPSGRSSPVIMDLNGDGQTDLLSGNTAGEILLYNNQGTNEAPIFFEYSYVTAAGVKIDLPDLSRSRPFVADWTGDGLPDLLVGSGDGRVRLYESIAVPEPSTAGLLVAGLLAFAVCSRRRKEWAPLNRPSQRHPG